MTAFPPTLLDISNEQTPQVAYVSELKSSLTSILSFVGKRFRLGHFNLRSAGGNFHYTPFSVPSIRS